MGFDFNSTPSRGCSDVSEGREKNEKERIVTSAELFIARVVL